MHLKPPTIVIFDMDGTTVRHIRLWLLHSLEWLDDQSYKFHKLWTWLIRSNRQGPMPLPWQESDRKRPPKLLVHRAIHKLRKKEVDQIVEPSPGIYELLDFLKSKKIPIALVSNGLGKGYGHDILKKFKLNKYFSSTIFREDIIRSKPNPECLHLTIKNLGYDIQEDDVIWFIGDRHKDVKAALEFSKHIPGEVIPIAYSFNAARAILENALSPEHIIMSYYDMKDRLDLLYQSK